jgi:hypothetical protein
MRPPAVLIFTSFQRVIDNSPKALQLLKLLTGDQDWFAIELPNKFDGAIFGEIYWIIQVRTPATFHYKNAPLAV